MIAIEGAIYCKDCVARLSRLTPLSLALRYPAAHKGKGTCRGCGETVNLTVASKVIRKQNRFQDGDRKSVV